MIATLQHIGSGWFSGPLEGHTGNPREVFVNKTGDKMCCAIWEIREHDDGGRTHWICASGELHPTDSGYAGQIVQVLRGKVCGWYATAERGSRVVRFEETE